MKKSKEFEKFRKGFAKEFKEARTDAGYTQEYLGKLLGVTAACICYYETGSHLPGVEMLFKIAKVFGNFRINFID